MTSRTAPTLGVPSAPPLPAELDELLRRLRLPHIRRRARSALATRRAAAGFPTGKTFHAWQPELSSIPAPTQQALRTLEWIGRRENLVVCGPSGTGKTFLLEALGQQAVEAGLHVAWFTLENLGVLLRRHRADDTVSKAIARILRTDVVVVGPRRPSRASCPRVLTQHTRRTAAQMRRLMHPLPQTTDIFSRVLVSATVENEATTTGWFPAVDAT